MSYLFGQDADLSERPQPNERPDLPTTFGETFAAQWSRNQLFSEDYFGEHDRFNALQDYLNTIKQRGGPDIGPELDWSTGMTGAAPAAQQMLEQTNAKLGEFKKNNPAFDLQAMTADELEQNAVAKRRAADADFEHTMSRERGRGATLGSIAGGIVTGFGDPINLALLPIAPEESLGIVANAIRWGVIGGAGAAASTALQAPYREEVEPGYLQSGQPFADILTATGETAVGGLVFRAAADAWSRVMTGAWPESVKQAGNVVASQANTIATNVYPGPEGEAAHAQALVKASNDILRSYPVDVSKYITPELEARAVAPIEAARTQAQAAVQRSLDLRAAAPAAPQPELPFARTEAEAEAERAKEAVSANVQQRSRTAAAPYDMPAEEAARVTDKMMKASPEEAQDMLRDLHMSPRQVADAPTRIEAAPEPEPLPVKPVTEITPELHDAVRADLDRELLATAREFRAAGFSIPEAIQLAAEHRAPYAPGAFWTKLAAIDARQKPATLPEQHARYFKIEADTQTVPIEDLVSSKTAAENEKGARNAAKRLAASAGGELDRREPITVRPLPDGRFLVVDGNGTFTAAKEYGWKSMPVQLEPRSEGGMPSLAAKAGPTGGASEISPKVAPPGTQPLAVQPSTLAEPSASLTTRYAPPSIWPVSRTVRFSDFRVGDIDQASKRNILHGSNNINELRTAAQDNQAELSARLTALAGEVPGIHFDKARVKDLEGVQAKVAAKGRPPNTISDYLGARVVADTPHALFSFVDKLHEMGAVIEGEEFIANPKPGGYRAVHVQIGLGDGTSAELQIVPKPIEEVHHEAHEIRQPVKRIQDKTTRTPEEDALYTATMAKAKAIMDKAWTAAPGWGAPGPAPIAHALPNGVQMFSPNQLGVDAERFQFKAGGDEAGVTDRLKGVKNWDPIKAGMVLTWLDKDGRAWIVDGHQRLGLAKRIAAEDPTQNPQLLARTLREDEGITAEKARTIAALKNIAEGTGTAIDAAKVIRDHPELAGDLPPRSELVRQARGLVNLSPDAFRMVVNEVVPPNYASIVGRLVPADADMQTALLHLLAKTDPANAVQAEAIARQGINAGLAKAEAGAQASLFGDQEVAQSLYVERAKVLDRALKTLRRDKTVFGTLVREQQTLAEAGNVLAHEINQQRMTADGQALQILQTLANRAGPISDALRTAAGRAKSDGYATATREFVKTIRGLSETGDLARLANGIERGATHVGEESTASTIDRGLAAEPVKPELANRAEQQINDLLEKTGIKTREGPSGAPGVRPGADYLAAINAMRTEPGAEGLPQGIMPGMEPSARQLAAAREGPLRAGVAQHEPGELFGQREPGTPDMFPNIDDKPVSLEGALREVDGYKAAAEQLATCGAPVAEAA